MEGAKAYRPDEYPEADAVPVGSATCDRLDKALAVLSDRLVDVDRRLTPMLRPPVPTPSAIRDGGEPDRSDRSPVVIRMEDLGGRIARMTERVENLLARVDLP